MELDLIRKSVETNANLVGKAFKSIIQRINKKTLTILTHEKRSIWE